MLERKIVIDPDSVTSDDGTTIDQPVYMIEYFYTNKCYRYNVIPVAQLQTTFIVAGTSSYNCEEPTMTMDNPDGFKLKFDPIEDVLELFYNETGDHPHNVQIVSMKLISVVHSAGDCAGA